MSLGPHVNNIVKSCNHQLRFIGSASKFLTAEALEKVIHAFISSRLDNGNSLLHGLPDTLLDKLQRVQNTAARILTRTSKFDHISPVFHSLHWLKVPRRIEFEILTLTHKCLHGKAPQYLQDMIILRTGCEGMKSSNTNLLIIPSSKNKSMGDRSFSVAGPTLWNKLPVELRCLVSFETFKTKLKSYLF